jgi:signal transduction histidine kinase
MSTKEIELNQALPAEVAAGKPGWWLAYRRYPVFSWPWVWRRGLLFLLFILAWGALSGLGHYAQGYPLEAAIALTAWFVFGTSVIVNGGPVLAALVRHTTRSIVQERWGVLLAMMFGLVLAYFADMLSSSRILAITGGSIEFDISGWALVANWAVLLLIYLLLGGGLALRAYFSEVQRVDEFRQEQALAGLRAEKLEADQQLAMLQAQVEPHFLFNTLATIRSELRRSPDRAEQTLDALCDYLRSTIPRLRDTDGASLSTLGEQFEICRHYLKVMQGRMGERLSFETVLEPALASHPFPPLLLLSLVENAVGHGIEPKSKGGSVRLSAERDQSRLLVRVVDDGVGLSAEVGHGVGLSNVRKQLELRYGASARLTLTSSEAGGVEAMIRMPWEEAACAQDR